jgi:polar amino acid transport system substrate-binding protein
MKRSILVVVVIAGVVSLLASGVEAGTLKLCVDGRDWYPFTYREGVRPKGMHVDIVTQALEQLDYEFVIVSYPRSRCISSVQSGVMDGMISVAYDSNLARFFTYPPRAKDARESEWRIMQVDYVVVTYIEDDYEFQGDVETLPAPIRITSGETLTEEFQKVWPRIEKAATDEENFYKLIHERTGVVITTSVMAENMTQHPQYQGLFKIQATPLVSLSYYLAFSRKAAISFEEKKRIWQEVAKWRDDYVYMLQMFAQY